MVDITDTNNSRGKLENEWESLERAEIDDCDREAIHDFGKHREKIEDVAVNTLISDLGTLRRAAARADVPLVEMTMADVRVFLGRLTDPTEVGGYGLKPGGGGVYGYERALRVFFNFLDAEADFGDYGFAERIELSSRQYEETITEDDLLSEEEIEQLKSVAKNPRDKALIDFLADVGARISLTTSLRVGDIAGISTPEPTFRPNMDAVGLKGVEDRQYPILYSRAELREWVNRHHPDPHPDAPLFPIRRNYDPAHRDQGAVSGDAVRDRLCDIREWAGIDTHVHPHHFRHVFMTRIRSSDLTDRDVEYMSMLTDDQMRMLDVYDHTSDARRNESIFAHHGFVDPDAADDDEPQLRMVDCPNCRERVKSTAHYCPRCSVPIREDLRDAVDEVKDASMDYLVNEDNPRKRRTARGIAQIAESDPDFAEELVTELQRLRED